MLDVLLLFLYSAAVGVVSWSLVRLLFGDRPAWWRFAVGLALFPVSITVELTVLGAMGWLAPHVAGVLMVIIALALWIAVGRRSREHPGERHLPEGLSREGAVGLAALLGVVLPPVARALLTGPQFGYDDFSYHAPFVTQWMIDGRISVLPFNYHAYFPFNAELFSLWFMLPTGADTFVGFGGAYWTIAAATSVTALALSLGRRVESAFLAGALVVVSTLVPLTALRFSANDLAGTVMIASALVVLSGAGAVREHRFAEALVAGTLIGFGLGAKLTMLPAVAVMFGWILLGARGGQTLSGRIGNSVLFISGIVVATGYWYGRNWLLTGNPFFPGAIAFLEGPLGSGQDQTKLITFLLADPAGTLGIVMPALTNWPIILWLVATAGYARGILMLFRKSATDVPASRALEAVLLLVGLSLLLAFPFQPFSATLNQPGAPVAPGEPRFLIVSFMVGIVLASSWIAGLRGVVVATTVVVAAGLMGNQLAGITAALLALAAWFAPRQYNGIHRFLRARRSLVSGVLAVAFVAGAILWRGNLEKEIERRIFSYRSAGQLLGPLWKEVNALPAGSRVVAYGLAGNFSYPLFGRSLDSRPVMLDRSGALLQPVHSIWALDRDRFEWWAPPPDSTELAVLQTALPESGVTHVAISRTSAGLWPVQAGVLLPPHFTVIHSDAGTALYKLTR